MHLEKKEIFMSGRKLKEIEVYDKNDTSFFIDKNQPIRLKDLGIELPEEEPTKVISLRMPTALLNRVKAYASQKDIPYSSMIKLLIAESMKEKI